MRNRESGAGVSHGIVMLLDAVDGRILGHVPVGQQGQYAFRLPQIGAYLIQYVGPGYGPFASREFTLAPGETRVMGLEVGPLPPSAHDSVLVAGTAVPARLRTFYERRASEVGEFLMRQQIDRMNAIVTTDLLSPLSGVSVVRVGAGQRVASRQDPARCGRTNAPAGPVLFLDGVFIGRGMGVNLDVLLVPSVIEAAEVYSGALGIPPGLERDGAECGVVALWTRASPPAAVETPVFEAGAQFGTWVASGGLAEGRFGVKVVISLVTGIEITAGVNRLVTGLETGTAGTDRTGTQVSVGARFRPLGRRSPVYLGAGATFVSFQRTLDLINDEEHIFLFGGVVLPKGRLRPFVEAQVLSPFGETQLHA
ncbi:MAG TPA: TonB-dependent receptor, partial [Gemmatimonadales bacterium]|nr:TonB-dependent receptor [Gemmatimonadales bacterium]